jgi:hypothetical protein
MTLGGGTIITSDMLDLYAMVVLLYLTSIKSQFNAIVHELLAGNTFGDEFPRRQVFGFWFLIFDF